MRRDGKSAFECLTLLEKLPFPDNVVQQPPLLAATRVVHLILTEFVNSVERQPLLAAAAAERSAKL
jgi:hypothetical protein